MMKFSFIPLFFVFFACQKPPIVKNQTEDHQAIFGNIQGNSQSGKCPQESAFQSALNLVDSAQDQDISLKPIENQPDYKKFSSSLPQNWEIHSNKKSVFDDMTRWDINFFQKNVQKPICNLSGVIILEKNQSFDIRTTPNALPTLDISGAQISWVFDDKPLETAIQSAFDALVKNNEVSGNVQDLRIADRKECLYPDQNQKALVPAIDLRVFANNIPIKFLIIKDPANGNKAQVVESTILSIHIDGQIQAFNPKQKTNTTSLKIFNIRDMEGQGFLCSKMFNTIIPSWMKMAFNESFMYAYTPQDQEFREAAIYAYANNMWQFFQSLGFNNWAKAPITLFVQDQLDGGPMYNNPDMTSNVLVPTIFLTPEVKKMGLRNLETDNDVVSHELTHHIVSQFVGVDNVDESRIIHEGLADAFTFLQTGDSCLGETICEPHSSICTSKQCLRNGKNDLKVGEQPYEKYAWHQKSQIISGIVWDQYIKSELPLKDVSKILANTVRHLSRSTNFGELLQSFIKSTQNLYGENDTEHVCKVVKTIRDRGLGARIQSTCP